MSNLSLVADVGGTNTRMALADGVTVLHESVRRYVNRDHDGIEAVIRHFLDDSGERVSGACLAMAGPVENGVGRLTNLDWVVDGALLRSVTGAGSVAVLNDLQAQGFALDHVPLRPVVKGRAGAAGATRLVVGVGTGFNAAPVHIVNGARFVPPSESGHINLPVRTTEEAELADHLTSTHGIASVEEALSGRGLEAMHRHVTGRAQSSKDIIPAIGTDPDATTTARLFIGLLGSVVGNLALVHLPFGGIALCGGMSRALAPHLDTLGFAAAMHDKGRFSDFVSAFPVAIIEDDYAALTGCAASIR